LLSGCSTARIADAAGAAGLEASAPQRGAFGADAKPQVEPENIMSAVTSTEPIQTDEPVLFDERGFLASPELWTRDLALGIAKELGIPELSEDHWRIVDRLRDHFLATGQLPVQPTLCRELELDSGCIQDLFDGPLHAWRVAGLPYPGEEALTYMNNMDIDETGSGS
jgi:dissimilatory sulfite reductase related protein